MLETELPPIIVARYCATDGFQINPQVFDEDAKFVVEAAANVSSYYSDLKPDHVLFNQLLMARGILNRAERRALINAARPHLNLDLSSRYWNLEGVVISDEAHQSFVEAKGLAQERDTQLIGLQDLFPPTVNHTSRSFRQALMQGGIDIDQLVEKYVTAASQGAGLR